MKALVILSLTILNGERGLSFDLSPQITNRWKNDVSSRLCMGYLDDLSPPPPPPEGDESSASKQGQTPPLESNKKAGIVPSGRGGLSSYLDIVTNNEGLDQPEPQTEQENEEGEERMQPRGSGAYLTSFLTGDDDARTDIRNLLTQQSIQGFLRLCEECRDPHSAKWITQDFFKIGNLLDYHGTGSRFLEDYGGLWDAPLLAMISQPMERIIISAKKRGRGHGGWSKNNPYLKERWMELPMDIDPPTLASRILQVREQIAKEWVTDLDVLIESNDLILDSFFKTVKEKRDSKNDSVVAGGDAFERTAVFRINDVSRFSISSPCRRSNFDLMYNLCTQAAIHRILRQKKANGEEREVSFIFLRDFYVGRAEEYFDGNLLFGQADDFVDDLLQTSPSLLTTDHGVNGLVDPVGAAEMIIKMRKEVAEDWKDLMKQVPEDHTSIRQALVSSQIQRSSPLDDSESASFQ
jgi:hypothetical protein